MPKNTTPHVQSGKPQADFARIPVREMSEQELLAVAGGLRSETLDTHVHMSCCNDCHSAVRCTPTF